MNKQPQKPAGTRTSKANAARKAAQREAQARANEMIALRLKSSELASHRLDHQLALDEAQEVRWREETESVCVPVCACVCVPVCARVCACVRVYVPMCVCVRVRIQVGTARRTSRARRSCSFDGRKWEHSPRSWRCACWLLRLLLSNCVAIRTLPTIPPHRPSFLPPSPTVHPFTCPPRSLVPLFTSLAAGANRRFRTVAAASTGRGSWTRAAARTSPT